MQTDPHGIIVPLGIANIIDQDYFATQLANIYRSKRRPVPKLFLSRSDALLNVIVCPAADTCSANQHCESICGSDLARHRAFLNRCSKLFGPRLNPWSHVRQKKSHTLVCQTLRAIPFHDTQSANETFQPKDQFELPETLTLVQATSQNIATSLIRSSHISHLQKPPLHHTE